MTQITITFETGNAAFSDDWELAISMVLEQARDWLDIKKDASTADQKKLRDYNGNTIGSVSVTP